MEVARDGAVAAAGTAPVRQHKTKRLAHGRRRRRRSGLGVCVEKRERRGCDGGGVGFREAESEEAPGLAG